MVKVDAKELGTMARNFRRASQPIRRRLSRAVDIYSARTHRESLRTHKWEDWTGKLSSAHSWTKAEAKGRKIRGSVDIDLRRAFYGWFQYWGTRAHGPVVAPFLVFKTRAGQWVKTKWVRGINNNQADPWVEDAAKKNLPFFSQVIERELGTAWNSLWRG